ncbi:hypothetical protein Moror_5503 [Moniliophthora roreri MCA 2997]|uniref:Uncharacterized protein n=2 Tax=Moniliophthora roreri TaxID=221103 RepID=V2WN08_MONRO|nr:hypothetical protein Moror_5503 [Moniliophthora roreri MCA 2997]
MAPTPTAGPKDLAMDTGFSLWSLGTQFSLLLVILSITTIIVWHWRFPCMTIKHLDTIVEDIHSLIRVDTPLQIERSLFDILPDMDAVKKDFESLLSDLSTLKQNGHKSEPRHIHLWSWLSFHCHQLFKIDALYWGFRDVKMKILAAVEKDKRQK